MITELWSWDSGQKRKENSFFEDRARQSWGNFFASEFNTSNECPTEEDINELNNGGK